MLYLLLSVVCSVLIANLLMLHGKKGDILPVFLGNYFVATLFSFQAWYSLQNTISNFELGFGILAGALFLGNFWVYQQSIGFNGLSLSVAVMRIAMIIPVLLAILIFGESIKLTGVLGILLAISAFALKAEGKQMSNLYWLTALFIISGLTDASLKIYKELGDGTGEGFIFVIFCSAYSFTLLIILAKKLRFSWKSLAFGFLLGFPNRLSTVFFLRGLDSIPASLAYPLVAVAIVVLSILSDLILWRKKAGSREILLWVILILSLVLLNL